MGGCVVDRVEKNREQREDTCQHTPHKANVQGHETITDAKQESGNKPGERGRWGGGCRCGACEYACATAWTLRGMERQRAIAAVPCSQ